MVKITFLSEVKIARGNLCIFIFINFMLNFILLFIHSIFLTFNLDLHVVTPRVSLVTVVLSLSLSPGCHDVTPLVAQDSAMTRTGWSLASPGAEWTDPPPGSTGAPGPARGLTALRTMTWAPAPMRGSLGRCLLVDCLLILMKVTFFGDIPEEKRTHHIESQMRSRHPSAGLDLWLWTGRTRRRASHTFLRRDTLSYFSR